MAKYHSYHVTIGSVQNQFHLWVTVYRVVQDNGIIMCETTYKWVAEHLLDWLENQSRSDNEQKVFDPHRNDIEKE